MIHFYWQGNEVILLDSLLEGSINLVVSIERRRLSGPSCFERDPALVPKEVAATLQVRVPFLY